VAFGLGGVFVEVLKDVVSAVAPLNRPEAAELVRLIKGFPVLAGTRGQPGVDLPAVEDLLEAADDAPIIRMLNALLTQGVRDGASDIHIEPYERASAVRFRVDGTLREVVRPNKALHAALISRLKIMAELDIAEKRLPQDGRISLRLGDRAVDVRVSTLPGAHGERAVLRLLDKSSQRLSLEGLGMSGAVLAGFERLVRQPHGEGDRPAPTGQPLADLAASFQQAAVDSIVTKVELALERTGCHAVAAGGGVAANALLRESLEAIGRRRRMPVFIPPRSLCTDNAAMGAIAWERLERGDYDGDLLDVVPGTDRAAANRP
jgi:hypothetical protein